MRSPSTFFLGHAIPNPGMIGGRTSSFRVLTCSDGGCRMPTAAVTSRTGLPAGEVLRDSLYHALLGSDAVGVAVCDGGFRYLLWNRFMEELTGLPAAAVLGRDALEVYPHLREERLERVLYRVLSGETVSLPDRRYTVPGVRSGWVSAHYWPHRGPDGSVAGVVGIVHDVTERKRAEEENERLA